MKLIERILRLLVAIGSAIGLLSIIALALLTVVTVIFRAFGIAFPGTYDLAEVLLIPAISFSLAYAAWQNAHTKVELLTEQLSPRVAGVLDAVLTALGTLFWVFIAQAGIRDALIRQAQDERTPMLDIPVAPFRWLMAAAVILLCCTLLFKAYQSLRAALPGETGHPSETK